MALKTIVYNINELNMPVNAFQNLLQTRNVGIAFVTEDRLQGKSLNIPGYIAISQ